MIIPSELDATSEYNEGAISKSPLSVNAPDHEPPPYSTTPSINPGQDDAEPEARRVNRVYLDENHSSVKGSWTIDPNVQLPPSLQVPAPKGEEGTNFYVSSKHGNVTPSLRLISDQPTTSTLHARSEHGNLTVKIVSPALPTLIIPLEP